MRIYQSVDKRNTMIHGGIDIDRAGYPGPVLYRYLYSLTGQLALENCFMAVDNEEGLKDKDSLNKAP